MHLLLSLLLIQLPSPITTVSGLVDEDSLTAVAREYQIPRVVMWVLAFKESGDGHKGNDVRGPGYRTIPNVVIRVDTIVRKNGTVVMDTIWKKTCREVGRFQILPCRVKASGHVEQISWAWLTPHCSRQNLKLYSHNIRCAAAILQYRNRRFYHNDWGLVIQRHNGRGKKSLIYRRDAERTVGQIVLRMMKADSVTTISKK